MSKGRSIIMCVVLMLVTSISYGQKDERATPILNKVSSTYKNTQCLKANFTLKIIEALGDLADSQKGEITLQGEKYILKMNDQQIISNGIAVWTYLSDINEVQIEEAEAGDGTITPSSIFTMYENGFKYKYVGEKVEASKKVHRIDLFPEDNEKPYFKVELSVDASDHIVSKAAIYDKNGSKYIYQIVKFEKMDKMTDDAFAFSVGNYPGIEVVDLR